MSSCVSFPYLVHPFHSRDWGPPLSSGTVQETAVQEWGSLWLQPPQSCAQVLSHSYLSIPFSLPIIISHSPSDSSFLIHWCICRMWRQLKELWETQGYSSTTASLTVRKWVGSWVTYSHNVKQEGMMTLSSSPLPLHWRWCHRAVLCEATLHCIGVHVHCIQCRCVWYVVLHPQPWV